MLSRAVWFSLRRFLLLRFGACCLGQSIEDSNHLAQASPDDAAHARTALTAALAPYADADAVRLRGTAWLVRATA